METPNYSFKADPAGGFHVTLKNQPPYCVALKMAPVGREAELNRGLWLVLVFAVWGAPQDFHSIDIVLCLAKEFAGKLHVGVRPFDKKEELQTWCPDAKLEWVSPTWLVLKEGELVNEMFGPQPREKVRETVQAHFGVGLSDGS